MPGSAHFFLLENKKRHIGQSNYSAAKAGVVTLTSTWGKELCRYGIRVGAIAPGYVNTEMVQQIRADVVDKIKAQVPLGRFSRARGDRSYRSLHH